MVFTRIVKQDFQRLKKTHPDLYANLLRFFPHLSDEGKGIAAGLIIEYVIKSGGDVDIFQDAIGLLEEDEDESF